MNNKDETNMTSDQTGDQPTQQTKQTNVVPLPHKDASLSPQGRALAFTREHPVMTIAGALAVGAVAAALIPQRNRRYVARQSSMLADAIAAAGATIAHQALASLDTASSGVARARSPRGRKAPAMP